MATPSPPSPDTTRWNVWLVTDVYPPRCGGSGWSTHALARVLTGQGHRVEVIVADGSADQVTHGAYEGIDVTRVGVRASRTLRRRLGATDYAYGAIGGYLTERLRASPEVDILHAQHLHTTPPAVAVGRAQGRATVATVRDYWPVCLHGTAWRGGTDCGTCTVPHLTSCMHEYWGWPPMAARLMVPWARRRLRARTEGVGAADKILAVSETVRRRLAPSLGAADLSVVPNIVDPEAVERTAAAEPSPSGSPYLLTAGKLQPTKGFDRLLETLAAVKPDLPLVVAGDGPSRESLEAQAGRLGVDATFLGWVEHSPLLRWQRDAHAVLLPSAWEEPLSRLVLETMALGTPVIAWSRGGNKEIIESGVSGWLVAEPSDLATALAELSTSERRHDVSLASVARVRERFAPSAVYPQIAAAYAAAVQKSRLASDA